MRGFGGRAVGARWDALRGRSAPAVRRAVIGVLRAWLGVAACSGALTSCISDLEPEVGPISTDRDRAPSQSETGEGGAGEGQTSDGSGGRGDGKGPGEGDGPADGDGEAVGDGDGETVGDGDGDGDNSHPGCAIGDTDPTDDVSFAADIMPVLAVCRCHNPQSDNQIGIDEAGLVIDGYENLRLGGDMTGADIVVGGDACKSVLLQKLSSAPPFGEQMPLEEAPLSLEVRTKISDWIVEGARDN